MHTVGIRELKGNLGRYLKRVKAGEKIVVTDRKQQIAVIMPLPDDSNKEQLYRLVQKGLASWSGGKPQGLPDRVLVKGKSVADAVIEDRR